MTICVSGGTLKLTYSLTLALQLSDTENNIADLTPAAVMLLFS